MGAATTVKFFYSHDTNWLFDNVNSVVAVGAGNFQSELGCAGDFAPDCLRSLLQDPDGNGVYSFSTDQLPMGDYSFVIALNENFGTTYGDGGLGGGNISFTITYNNEPVTITYNGTTHEIIVQVGVYVDPTGGGSDATAAETALAAPPCLNFTNDTGSAVRYGSLNDALSEQIFCRILYRNGSPVQWRQNSLYTSGVIGSEAVLALGVMQAVDIFSPYGLTYFDGGGVFCLSGEGALIWMPASNIPRTPQIIGSYTVPEFSGFTCATLFEPGTLILVRNSPTS